MKLYILEMLRYSNREKHSYVAGVFDNLDQALKEGVAHEIHRGGKYEFIITTVNLNQHTTYSDEMVKNYGEENFNQHLATKTLNCTAETDGEYL